MCPLMPVLCPIFTHRAVHNVAFAGRLAVHRSVHNPPARRARVSTGLCTSSRRRPRTQHRRPDRRGLPDCRRHDWRPLRGACWPADPGCPWTAEVRPWRVRAWAHAPARNGSHGSRRLPTATESPWFQAARNNRSSRRRATLRKRICATCGAPRRVRRAQNAARGPGFRACAGSEDWVAVGAPRAASSQTGDRAKPSTLVRIMYIKSNSRWFEHSGRHVTETGASRNPRSASWRPSFPERAVPAKTCAWDEGSRPRREPAATLRAVRQCSRDARRMTTGSVSIWPAM